MSSIHDGHRQRLKTRFVKSGLKDFEPHIALELILTFSIPRRDTNELAHRLIERYGSFDKVLEADYTSLLQVDGIGENTAAQLKVIFESYAYYEAQKYRKGFVAASSSVAMKYAQSLFVGEQSEASYLMCFDSKLKLINCPEITRGSISQTAVSVKRIVELATLHRASSVIVTHNHPNGVAMPSEDDIAATSTIMKALNLIDVKLSDHIVVGERFAVSMADAGVVFSIKEQLNIV